MVAEACDGDEALRKLDDIASDLVLTDVQMPAMDGFETAAKMLKGRLALSVVEASMGGNAEYPRMAEELGAIGFLKKSDLTATALLDFLNDTASRD